MPNPFLIPFTSAAFVGRSKEIRRIAGRIVNRGQSVAISGEQRIGKSFLLRYLALPEKRAELYGDLAPRLLFQYIDAQTFSAAFSPAQFWELALTPLDEKLEEIGSLSVNLAYETCKSEGFGVYGLEKLLAQLQAAGWQLVLMLDEFDNLLDHPVLNQSEFYGGLRSLATRCESLALITASRQPLEALNAATQGYSRLGSPYFNFMNQVTLGAFTDKDIRSLLAHSGERFIRNDREFLAHIAGGHPFLLAAAASALWEAYEEGETPLARYETTSRELLNAARPILVDTWRLWTPEKRKTVTMIALDMLPKLVRDKEFDLEALLASFTAYIPEMEELKERGFLVQDGSTRTGYRLQAQVMLWWLASELIRVTRMPDGDSLGDWLRQQEWGGQLKGEEKAQIQKAITILGGLLKTGSEAFIKATAEGFAKGLTK